jgi:hypothetical protein
MAKLVIEVTPEAAQAILEWTSTKDGFGVHNHRVFVTTSVPALNMWEVLSVESSP